MSTARFSHGRELDPQYELEVYRRKFRLTEAEATAFLEMAGTDRQVAESLAKIKISSRGQKDRQR